MLVILQRSPAKDDVHYKHDVLWDAIKRAEALCYLHGVNDYIRKDFGFVVDAREYYNKPKHWEK